MTLGPRSPVARCTSRPTAGKTTSGGQRTGTYCSRPPPVDLWTGMQCEHYRQRISEHILCFFAVSVLSLLCSAPPRWHGDGPTARGFALPNKIIEEYVSRRGATKNIVLNFQDRTFGECSAGSLFALAPSHSGRSHSENPKEARTDRCHSCIALFQLVQ